MTRFGMTRRVLGFSGFLEMAEHDFEEGRKAQRHTLLLLGVEEKIDLLLENYAELEGTLLELTLRHSLFTWRDWSEFMADLQTINRRLANLLTTSRLYIDQTMHDVGSIFGNDSKQLEHLRARYRTEYDTHLGYRVMEAVRNYMQHRSLPIHALSYPSNREEPNDAPARLRFRVVPSLKPSLCDKKFKSSVRLELEAIGDSIPLTPFIREYVGALGSVHEELRRTVAPLATQADELVLALIERAKETFRGETAGLCLISEDDSGSIAETVALFSDPIRRRKSLEEKNRSLDSIAARYVSGVTGQSE